MNFLALFHLVCRLRQTVQGRHRAEVRWPYPGCMDSSTALNPRRARASPSRQVGAEPLASILGLHREQD